ncbi:MAG: DUF4231 domain-containing protein [Thermoproteota archaeon]|nr:DUF4231 domain-containing protein [Thermoproteota archaeon]
MLYDIVRPDIRGYLRRGKQQLGRGRLQQNPNSNLSSEYYDINKPAEISDYIQKRFLPVFRWYKNRTSANARRFRFWRISIIILALFIVIFDILALGYYAGKTSSATAIASSIAAVLILGSTAFVQLTRTQENWILFSTISQRLEREYQLFMLKAGVYTPSTPSASTNEADDDKAKSRLFVENIESIISSHSSESSFQNPSAANQIPD